LKFGRIPVGLYLYIFDMSEGGTMSVTTAASIRVGVERVEKGNEGYLSQEEVGEYYPDELMGVVGLNELIERITGISGQTSRQGEQMWGKSGMGVLNPDKSKTLVAAFLGAIQSAAEEHVRRVVAEGRLQEEKGRDLLELISQMYQHTWAVIDRAFRVMGGESLIDVYPWLGNVVPRGAFLVPGRVGVARLYPYETNQELAGIQPGTVVPGPESLDRETVAHLPLTHLLDYDALVALLRLLPPIPVSCVLSPDGKVVAVAWWVPIFPGDNTGLSERSKILEQTIRVLNGKGMGVFGLGATLPAFIKILTQKLGSEEGEVPKASEVAEAPAPIITTGHAGTTAIVYQMVEEIISGKSGEEQEIGLFGLGNIGSAILKALVGRVFDITHIYVYDTKGLEGVIFSVKSIIGETIPKATVCVKEGEADVIVEITSGGKNIQVHAAGNPTIVWNSCNIVISTATTPVEVPTSWQGIAIDDSQPPMLMGKNVRWVVGEVPKGYVTRPVETWEIGGKSVPWSWGLPPGYNGYTETWGLADNKSAWGCLLEVLALMSLPADERRGHAITGPVSLKQIQDMRDIFQKLGIKPTRPQSRGNYLGVEEKTAVSASSPSP